MVVGEERQTARGPSQGRMQRRVGFGQPSAEIFNYNLGPVYLVTKQFRDWVFPLTVPSEQNFHPHVFLFHYQLPLLLITASYLLRHFPSASLSHGQITTPLPLLYACQILHSKQSKWQLQLIISKIISYTLKFSLPDCKAAKRQCQLINCSFES